ncbi:MAG: hypothetical protein QXX64_01480 [Nitrososphaera sp.]
MPVMAGIGMWLLLVIPAIVAFAFGAWVFYSMVIDVSERDTGDAALSRCVEGCAAPPPGLR